MNKTAQNWLRLGSLAVVHCWYFTLGMAIYGLIVYLNKDVIRAFEMADAGMSPEEILEEFSMRRRLRRRYYDDDYDREDERSRRSVEDSRDKPDDGDRFRLR